LHRSTLTTALWLHRAESKIIEILYTDSSVYTQMGKGASIALDVVFASGGCEAIVEGLVKVHKRLVAKPMII